MRDRPKRRTKACARPDTWHRFLMRTGDELRGSACSLRIAASFSASVAVSDRMTALSLVRCSRCRAVSVFRFSLRSIQLVFAMVPLTPAGRPAYRSGAAAGSLRQHPTDGRGAAPPSLDSVISPLKWGWGGLSGKGPPRPRPGRGWFSPAAGHGGPLDPDHELFGVAQALDQDGFGPGIEIGPAEEAPTAQRAPSLVSPIPQPPRR